MNLQSLAVVRYCVGCAANRNVDIQTDRCLTCGRLVFGKSVEVAPALAPAVARHSPSRAYRGDGVHRQLVEEAPPAPQPVVVVQESAPAQPAVTPAPVAATTELPVEPRDRRQSFVFGTPTRKRPCICGAFVVWRVDEIVPTICAFCGSLLFER